MHSQCTKAAIGRQTKARMFVENFSVQMDANIGLHIFWTVAEYPIRVDSFCHGPSTKK
jgi:hypothetical protein